MSGCFDSETKVRVVDEFLSKDDELLYDTQQQKNKARRGTKKKIDKNFQRGGLEVSDGVQLIFLSFSFVPSYEKDIKTWFI